MKLKLTSSQKRVLCTRLAASAWSRTLKSIDFDKAFRSLGYVWNDNSIIQPNHMTWYKFDPNSIESNELEIEDQDDNSEQHQQIKCSTVQVQQKQLTLKDMWKC